MASSSDHSATSITGRSFAVRRKGFDPDEVRAYLGQLAEVISRLTTERDGARAEVGSLRASAESRPEIDEDQLTEVLGEETARVLSSARRAATEIKDRAEETAARMRREAAEEAGAVRRAAEDDAARVREEAAAVRLDADEARRRAVEAAEEAAARLRAEAEAEATATREAAEQERAAAQEEAATVRSEADEAATATRAAADAVLGERTAEAEAAAAELVAQGRVDADAIREAAEGEAADIRARAEADRDALQDEGREMVAEAQRVRERMLADLSRRRKAARVQLEQLQAGRDRLLESYEAVQREVDAATSGLRSALPEARQAAEAARVRAEAEPADSVDQLEAQIAAARSAGLPLVAPEAADTEAAAEGEGADGEGPVPDGGEEAVDAIAAGMAGAVEAVDLTEPVDDTPEDGEPAVDLTGPLDLTDDGPAPDEGDGAPVADLGAEEWRPEDDDGVAAEHASAEPAAAEPAPEDAPPEDAPPEAVEVAPAAADESVAGDRPEDEEVDELFARLRASQEGAGATDGDDLVADVADVADDADDTDEAAPTAAAGEHEAEPDGAVAGGAPDVGAPVAAHDAPAPSEGGADGAGPADGDDGDPGLVDLLERRDGAIEPIETRVARRLKRVLADEQGRVLDAVRRAKRAPALDDVLPLDEQVAAYSEAVREDLHAAAEEGAAFEGAALPTGSSIVGVADELARSLAAVVRPRLERCFAAGEDPDDTSDRLRATYREWKTDSLVDATRHHVLAAFGEGQGAVRPAGAAVRWVPDPSTPACPDCEDDALASAVPSGDAFPTGHSHPPAHPGCRCLVVTERVGAPA
ncbi:DivIVA domain-containing protein [Iamia majanohamensis]|uniref:DivIVA domain-containing protein n=1 Tax=Iamia majanohamensis TaxID=467976 RepID=A0AAE9Y6G4_9ACTN|nr:DivIVA domain-containing protein [Iamia majanohamensis]WCO67560.1 DivIVA domain-containing protein [Iamia majanohamensis]